MDALTVTLAVLATLSISAGAWLIAPFVGLIAFGVLLLGAAYLSMPDSGKRVK